MINKELVQRINELAHKKKTKGLTDAEREEQQQLYKTYLASVREQVSSQLESAGIGSKDHQHHDCHDGCSEHHQHGPNCKHHKH